MTLSRPEVRRLLAENGIRASRARGQNFVTDANTVRRIARLAGIGPGDRVVEVGAGLGCLTLALAETGARITALEVDRGLVPILRQVIGQADSVSSSIDDRVRIVEADAMRLDWHQLLGDDSHVLVANLPYNIATPLIADLLDDIHQIGRMLVMVQQEVAERLTAGPGDDAYGAVSVKVAHWAESRIVGRVPPAVFFPVPNVESALVDIRRRAPAVSEPDVRAWMFRLVHAGFSGRRKMLRRALSGLADPTHFSEAGVRPEVRAEELGLDDWVKLARCSLPAEPS